MSAAINGLTGLKELYNEFSFRNRLGTAEVILLQGGDSVQVQPGATVTIKTELILQMPSVSSFEPIQPTIQDLIDAGLIATPEYVKPIPPEKPETPSTPSVKPVQGTGGTPIVPNAN
jgi:hypothetical protein